MSKNYSISCSGINENINGVFTFNNSKFEARNLLPGEKAKIELLFGKDKGKANVIEITKPSPERCEPICKFYNECGGCHLQHTNYANELKLKTAVVRDLLSKFCEVNDCIGNPDKAYGYRNKIHATFALNKKKQVVSGLYAEGTHKLISVTDCALEAPIAKDIVATIRDFMNSHGILPYNEDSRRGVIRHALLRVSASGDVLVCIVSGSKIFPEKNKLAEEITSKHSCVKTVVLNYNFKNNSMVLGDKEEILFGNGYIIDNLAGIDFRISAKSFYQINASQAAEMYLFAVKKANLPTSAKVLDAYCGIGTITSVIAKETGCKNVVGVELNKTAVKDAIDNASRAGLKNLTFINEDAGDYLTAAVGAGIKYDCIILDPPRSGASTEFLKALTRMSPEKVIYISCNPVTLKRDLIHFVSKGYKVDLIQPFDMFPRTSHVESVVLLNKKKATDFVEISVDAEDYYSIKEK